MSVIEIQVNETPNNPKNAKGTPVGNGLVAQDVALWIDAGTTPTPLTSAHLIGSTLPTGLTSGTTAITSTPAALPNHAGKAVAIRNDPTSTETVYVGDASGQQWPLVPGEPLSMDISNLNALYAKTLSGTATLIWMVAA